MESPQGQTYLHRTSSGRLAQTSSDESQFSLGGGYDTSGKAAQSPAGLLKTLRGSGTKEAQGEPGSKKASSPSKGSNGSSPSKPSVQKKFLDMFSPLLGNSPRTGKEEREAGNAEPAPSPVPACSEGRTSSRMVSQNSGLTEYVNKMQISENGKRSKLSNDSTTSGCSSMSIGSTMSMQSMASAGPAPPATPPTALHPHHHGHHHQQLQHQHNQQAQAQAAAVGGANSYTSNLDRLLDAARYCRLPQSGRPVQPMPADPFAHPHQGPTVLLMVAPDLPARMQRSHWCLGDYTVGEKLYTGYASTVFKAVCKRTNEVVVLKIYHLLSVCDLYKYQIYREVKVHSNLVHENIVHLLAAFQEGDKVIMVQEYADGADLFTMLHKYGGRLSERLAVQMVLEPFLRVLHYLHSRAIIHRDIKPENILFNKAMALKLGDFGLAIDMREERPVTRAGTLDYMAPEVLKCPFKSRPEENKEHDRLCYTARVDTWAVGVLTYELLVGFPPFFDQSRTTTEERINHRMPAFPPTVSDEAKDFINRALSKDVNNRPTVLEMLQHRWIDAYRTRRSMRSMPTSPAMATTTPRRPPATPSGVTPAAVAMTMASPSAPGQQQQQQQQMVNLHHAHAYAPHLHHLPQAHHSMSSMPVPQAPSTPTKSHSPAAGMAHHQAAPHMMMHPGYHAAHHAHGQQQQPATASPFPQNLTSVMQAVGSYDGPHGKPPAAHSLNVAMSLASADSSSGPLSGGIGGLGNGSNGNSFVMMPASPNTPLAMKTSEDYSMATAPSFSGSVASFGSLPSGSGASQPMMMMMSGNSSSRFSGTSNASNSSNFY